MMGLKDATNSEECTSSKESIAPEKLKDRPLYFWLKSFAGREIEDDANVSAFVSSNALNYALEYIGITPENEQSSLHLSAIFDSEDSPKTKYPNHYESETKSRIQSLNRVFLELKSFFEDRYSQLVAIRPPNSVHITSSCGSCSVQEFEKLLFLLLGAAIQGTQKQDTIRTIKRFPANIQESLIECVKLIADNPELLNVKSWMELQTMGAVEQQKIYESLLALVRKLILERNELTQNQLILDYFAGYTNCEQKRGFNGFSECSAEDTRLSSSMRQLKEQLTEKAELLQECREELEKARNRILDLEIEVNEMKGKHRAMKKARDELDALREGQDKAVRLEAELSRLKARLEESELVYERVENLEIENRNWKVTNDMLLDQISFLSFEKSSRDTSYDHMNTYTGILDGRLTENLKEEDFKDDGTFFDSDDEPSIKETNKMQALKESDVDPLNEEEEQLTKDEPDADSVVEEAQVISQVEEPGLVNTSSSSTIQPEGSPEREEEQIIERPDHLEISQTESIESGDSLVTSTPKASIVEFKSQEVQTPTHSRVKRRRRSSLLNLKRTRKAIIIPIPQGQKMPNPDDINELGEDSPVKNNTTSHTIQFYKVYSVDRKRGSSRPKKFKSPTKNISTEKQVVPNLDNEGNEADEELSISPTGNPNMSDLDSNNDPANGTDNDSEVYFVCSPPNSTGTNTPKKIQLRGNSHFGTTTAFPVSNIGGMRRTTEFTFDPHNLSDMQFNNNLQNQNHHSNHMTIYSNRLTTNLTPSPTNSGDGGGTLRNRTTTHAHHVPSYSQHGDIHRIGPNSSDDVDQEDHCDEDEDASNAFTFGDYNIQLNLRNSIKPSTALINKISTLSANLEPDHNHNFNQYSTISRDPYTIETSSEEDGSIWYEYGCV